MAPRHETNRRDFALLVPEPAPSMEVRDRFEEVRRELSRWGADYMVLEYFAEEEAGYRFRCRVPLPENNSYARPFEASHRDPLAAMEGVLGQVVRWRSEYEQAAAAESRSYR